jgi:hypothetical protein
MLTCIPPKPQKFQNFTFLTPLHKLMVICYFLSNIIMFSSSTMSSYEHVMRILKVNCSNLSIYPISTKLWQSNRKFYNINFLILFKFMRTQVLKYHRQMCCHCYLLPMIHNLSSSLENSCNYSFPCLSFVLFFCEILCRLSNTILS